MKYLDDATLLTWHCWRCQRHQVGAASSCPLHGVDYRWFWAQVALAAVFEINRRVDSALVSWGEPHENVFEALVHISTFVQSVNMWMKECD